MKRLVTGGMIVAAITMASGCAYFRGWMGSESTGKTELRQSFEAKKSARSYRMKMSQSMTAGAKLETEVEVACPDRERIVSRLGPRTFKTIRIAGDAFLLNPDGQWDKLSLPPRSIPCGGNPGAPAAFALMNEGRDLSAVVGDMLNDSRWTAEITPGSSTHFGSDACQEWTVSFHPAKGSPSSDDPGSEKSTLCIGTADHLPRQFTTGDGATVITYLDWNKPVEITAPTVENRPAPSAPVRSY